MFEQASNHPETSIFQPVSEPTFLSAQTHIPHLHSVFRLKGNPDSQIDLTLNENYLILGCNGNWGDQYYYAPIEFQLKFQVIYQSTNPGISLSLSNHSKAIGFKLLKKHAPTLQFHFIDQNMVVNWLQLLSKHLSQIGFHQLFQPLSKLKIKATSSHYYLAKRITDGRLFTIKAHLKSKTIHSTHPVHRLAFFNEIKIMRTLDHPNIAKFYSLFQTDNSLYLLLEPLAGDTLYNHLSKRAYWLTQNEIKTLMRGLMRGLNALHSKNIMHRSITLQHIMLRDAESIQPVIIGFELATDSTLPDYLYYKCGVPGYVAPEVLNLAKGQQISPVCDIFSAAAIFNTLLTKKPLFSGSTVKEVMQKNKQLNFDFKSQIYKHVSEEAMDLLKQMLKPIPFQRLTASKALEHPYLSEQIIIIIQPTDNWNPENYHHAFLQIAAAIDLLNIQ